MSHNLRLALYVNTLVVVLAAAYLFLIPAGILVSDLRDPGLSNGTVPPMAFGWHRALSAQMGPWALARVASGRAAQLSTSNISATEWPIFSAVYYLWATDGLESAWEQDPSLAPVAPRVYAHDALQAVAALVADPNHASWVKQHWGDEYLHHEDLFYRMLLIGGLTSYQKVSGDRAYQPLLKDQVETLSQEIDASRFGLLDDYPGQCYPIDILPAIAAIKRADAVLGTDHTAFINRARRAFEGARLDPKTGLPAYRADSKTGTGIGSARGVGLSYMLTWMPELWPEKATEWYRLYDAQFWQQDWLVSGWREFPSGNALADWYLMDVDAGPVLSGYGTAASAFGIGSARANGRMDQAYALSGEALIASWPLPDGTLLGPRLLSNLSDAPYIGEAALLFVLTRTSSVPPAPQGDLRLPWSVYVGIALYVALALVFIGGAAERLIRSPKRASEMRVPFPQWQFIAWLVLATSGVAALFFSSVIVGSLLLVVAQYLPFSTRFKRNANTD